MAQANEHSDGGTIMKRKFALVLGFWLLLIARRLLAQDLGPHFVKLVDGIYVYARDAQSNCGIIVTQEGVMLIDSGPHPPDSHIILKAVRQLTTQPVRFLINTETHNDHTAGNFVFSPPAIVIGAQGATQGIKSYYDPERNEKLIAQSAEMREAFRGFRLVTPHVEFHDRMVLQLGGRTLELMQLNNIHSDADTAIWLPKERVLLSGGKERLDSNIEAAFRAMKK
jgi:cyclase